MSTLSTLSWADIFGIWFVLDFILSSSEHKQQRIRLSVNSFTHLFVHQALSTDCVPATMLGSHSRYSSYGSSTVTNKHSSNPTASSTFTSFNTMVLLTLQDFPVGKH